MSLAYYPGSGEQAINVTNAVNPALVTGYTIENYVTDSDSVYKIWVVPKYITATDGYALIWYLTDLNYSMVIDITNHVTVFNTEGDGFEPTNYGNEQYLVVNVDIADVIPSVSVSHEIVQTVKLTVSKPKTVSGTAWVIDYYTDGTGNLGTEMRVLVSNVAGTFNVANQMPDYDSWKDRLYGLSDPLYDTDLYSEAPTPSHIRFRYGNSKEVLIPVSDWNNEIPKQDSEIISQFDTMVLEWLYYDSINDIYKVIAITPMVCEVIG